MTEVPRLKSISVTAETAVEEKHDVPEDARWHSLEYDESMTLRNMHKHIQNNRRLCEEAFGNYKVDRGSKVLVNSETGNALSTRNLRYYHMHPCLYFPDSPISKGVSETAVASSFGLNTTARRWFMRYYDVAAKEYTRLGNCRTVGGLKRKMKQYIRERAFYHKIHIKQNVLSAASSLLCKDMAVAAGYCDHLVHYGP